MSILIITGRDTMSSNEDKINRLSNKILYYSLKKLEYIKANNIERALVCSRIIELLYWFGMEYSTRS